MGLLTSFTRPAAPVLASHKWDGTDIARTEAFWVADRRYRVTAINYRINAPGSDAGTVTAAVRKVPTSTAVAGGILLHTGTINLKATAASNGSLTLSSTASDLILDAGEALGFNTTGTTTGAQGCLTVALVPA